MLISCQSDKNKTKQNNTSAVKSQKTESKTLTPLKSAYNYNKFKKEKFVKFNFKLIESDSVLFEGNLNLNTDASEIKFKNSRLDTVLKTNDIRSKFDKIVLWSAEIYALPFWIDSTNEFQVSKKDSLDSFKYKSELSNTTYEIFKHPQTHIIKKVKYSTDIDTKPFDNGTLTFDKYITVNRIPVAMKWKIQSDSKRHFRAEISSISY